ncbi:MAG: response regulator [Bryobacteraceae bacterium]
MTHSPNILVVEDDPALRSLFAETLAQDGYHVTAVPTAAQALSCSSDFVFDIVVVDLSLPDSDGLEFIRHLSAHAPLSKMLAMSGYMDERLSRIAMAAGADATLAKPATPRQLRHAVYRLIDPTCAWLGS